MNLMAERVESLKAGLLAAGAFAIAHSAVNSINQFLLAKQFETLTHLQSHGSLSLLLGSAIALISGFVFGVTYRYIIRKDQNAHLKQGAIFAFGLVRGLAQVEVGWNYPDSFWAVAILGVESIWLFAIAGITLDWAIRQAWIEPL